MYVFFVAPTPNATGRVITRDDTGETMVFAPGATPSPIHTRFGDGASAINATPDGRRTVRIVTTTEAIHEPIESATVETVEKPKVTTPTTVITPEPDTTTNPTPTTVTKPPVTDPTPTTPQTASYSPLKWGVYAGATPTTIAEFERRIDTNPDYLAYFVHWGNDNGKLPAWLASEAAAKGRTLVLFWEASDHIIGGTNQPAYSYDRILAGDWDDYFADFADQLRAYPGQVILIPFSELNGNWTPWSGTLNGNTPQKAVAAWQYLHGFVGNISNVKIGWAVNAASVPDTAENQIENYYPGSAYVDIVGVDGFNDGPPWYSFAEIFGGPLTTLSRYGKPVMIFSFASAEGPKKADWMRDGFFNVLPQYPRVTGWVWFNQNKERNWLIWSDQNALAVFKEAIGEE